jgi:hypothetical protein
MYIKICPSCGVEVVIKSKYYYIKNKDKICKSCSGKKHRGKTVSESTRQRMRDNHKNFCGENNPFYGKSHTEETKEKLRRANINRDRFTENYKKSLKDKMKGPNNPFYGKSHTEETKEKLRWPKTEEHKKKLKISMKGKPSNRKGKPHTEESKRKMRISAIKRLESTYGSGFLPSYNKKESEYFLNLQSKMGWDGIFIGNNNRQYYIDSLGYFVDYYEPTLNIVVEYDETSHYDKNWNLKERDVIRMNEIKQLLNCRFFRYNEVLDELREY